MNIFITGLNGFIGRKVKSCLKTEGYNVFTVSKEVLLMGGVALDEAVIRADIIINLAGASVMSRWTTEKKIEIMESRRVVTRNLVEAVNRLNDKLQLFINASAVGVYRAGDYYDESAVDYGDDFLAQVVERWEEEAAALRNVRKVVLRLGIVIGKSGGVWKKLSPFVKMRIAFIMGSGHQEFPLISIEDVTGFILYAIRNPEISGIYNMVIPQPVNYHEFALKLAGKRKPFIIITLPERFLKWVLGEMSVILTRSAHVIPSRLMQSGYMLKYRTLDEIVN